MGRNSKADPPFILARLACSSFLRRHGPSGESQVGELVYLLQLVQFSSTLSAGCMHVEAECSG